MECPQINSNITFDARTRVLHPVAYLLPHKVGMTLATRELKMPYRIIVGIHRTIVICDPDQTFISRMRVGNDTCKRSDLVHFLNRLCGDMEVVLAA